MRVFFNESEDKAGKLIQSLRLAIDLNQTYRLTVVSCFLSDDINDLLTFINDLSRDIHLSQFTLYIDSRQIIKIGVAPLVEISAQICLERGEGWFEIVVVDTPHLIHSKGYVLLSENETAGALVVSSSNFSKHGFFDQVGNYEAALLTHDLGLVQAFLESIPQNYLKKLNELEVFESINSFTFQYALIREGLFVRQWNGTIEQYFAVKYELTELGQQQVDSGEFQALGFSVDVDMISRKYLSFEKLSPDFNLLELLHQGIETHLGYWIPKSLILNQDNKKKVEQFYGELSACIDRELVQHKVKIELDCEMLITKGFIVQGQSPISQTHEKLHHLENDDLKIEQLRSRLSVFIVPYNLTQTREINGVFEELRGACVVEPKSDAMYRVLNAMKQKMPCLVNYEHNGED